MIKFSEFERRFATVMLQPIVIGDDSVARISPQFEALAKDIAEVVMDPKADPQFQALAQAIDGLKQSLSDPEFAQFVAQQHNNPYQPPPPIFDAIEERDVEAVKAALATWDINRGVGEFDATALYRAMSCMFGISLDVINLLLDAGADPKKGLSHTNVLHGLGFANLDGIASADLAKVILRCVAMGADIEQRSDKLQWTPLIGAASEWNPIAVEALILAGANLSVRAGEVDGVCYSGADCMTFAAGHAPTQSILKRYLNRN